MSELCSSITLGRGEGSTSFLPSLNPDVDMSWDKIGKM